jgi:hypothetical protein
MITKNKSDEARSNERERKEGAMTNEVQFGVESRKK